MSSTQDHLPDELRFAARALRELPVARDEWRTDVLRAVEAQRVRRLLFRGQLEGSAAAWLIAASICVLVGVGAGAALARRPAARGPAPVAAPAAGTSVVQFRFVSQGAARVSIVGDFNAWDPQTLPLRRSADGSTWTVEVPLRPGRYTYSFFVDGALARDPDAPQARDADFGSSNSVVVVRGS